MASISDIVNVTVSTLTAAIKQPGFGIPLIADYHTRFSDVLRHYNDLDSMVTDGFLVTDAAYKAASAAFAQDPQLSEIVIGRRTLAPVIQCDIAPTAVNSKDYVITVTKPDGTLIDLTYTSDSTATVAEIVTGLVTAINALAGSPLTATDLANGHTTVRVVAAVSTSFFAIKVHDKALLSIKQTHADPGIATDLANFAIADQTWYGLTLSSQGKAEIQAAAAWAEPNNKLMLQASQDCDVIVSGSGDVASALKTSNLFRTGLIFASDPTQHAGSAWLGAGFPIDPGGLTFANLTLAAVDTEALTGSHITQLKAKNCNYMTSYGSVVLTRNGVTAAGEFIDIIRDRDWYEAQLQTECLAVMVNNKKVPFTDRGIAQLEAAVRTATKRAIDAGFLAEGSDAYVIPKASDVSPTDRANRTLGATPIKVSAQVQGAIQVAVIRATVTA